MITKIQALLEQRCLNSAKFGLCVGVRKIKDAKQILFQLTIAMIMCCNKTSQNAVTAPQEFVAVFLGLQNNR